MIEQANDDDGINLVIHLAVDRDIRTRFAVALAQVPGQLDPRGERLRAAVLLNHFNVAVVAALEARAAHADQDGIEWFRCHSCELV